MTDADLPLSHAYVPPEPGGATDPPAAVVLHGRGADEDDLLPVARHLPDALAVVSLRAPDRLQGGYTWYALDVPDGDLHRSQPDADDFRRSLDAVGDAVGAAAEAYGLDPDRIGLLGFSQGAVVSLALLLETPARYAWVAALHGYLAASHADRAPDGVAGKPVFVGAGRGDRVIPASRAADAAERLRDLGADVEHGVYAGGHGIGPEELDDLVGFVGRQV